jgi:hypothetical protein
MGERSTSGFNCSTSGFVLAEALQSGLMDTTPFSQLEKARARFESVKRTEGELRKEGGAEKAQLDHDRSSDDESPFLVCVKGEAEVQTRVCAERLSQFYQTQKQGMRCQERNIAECFAACVQTCASVYPSAFVDACKVFGVETLISWIAEHYRWFILGSHDYGTRPKDSKRAIFRLSICSAWWAMGVAFLNDGGVWVTSQQAYNDAHLRHAVLLLATEWSKSRSSTFHLFMTTVRPEWVVSPP